MNNKEIEWNYTSKSNSYILPMWVYYKLTYLVYILVTLFKFYACSNFPNHIILQHTRPWQIWQKWCFDCPKFVRIILVGLPQQSEQTYITYTQNISYIFHDFSSFGFVALVVLCVLYVHSSEIQTVYAWWNDLVKHFKICHILVGLQKPIHFMVFAFQKYVQILIFQKAEASYFWWVYIYV